MFKIGEFSKLMQVSVRMLRYYDEAGLLKPAETDPGTLYRFYSAEQIPLLNRIIFLRDSGFNVSEISMCLKHWEDDFIAGQLERKRNEITKAIKAEEEKLHKISLAKSDLKRRSLDLHCNVTIKPVAGCLAFTLRRTVSGYDAEGQLWQEFSAYADLHRIPLSEPCFTLYHDSEYKEEQVDMELCTQVRTVGIDRDGYVFREMEPVRLMASTMVYGHFGNIAGAYQAVANWLAEHNRYRMSGPSRQIVHRGPWNEPDPHRYIIELQLPLTEK